MSRIRSAGNYWACFAGVITMSTLSVLTVLVLPIFIINEYLPMEYTAVLVIILMGMIAFCGALVTGFMSESRRALLQFLACSCYYLIVLFVSVAFFEGLSMGSAYNLVACGAAYAAAVLVAKRTKKSRVKRKSEGEIVKMYKIFSR